MGARRRRLAQPLTLHGGIGQSHLLGRFGGGGLALGGVLMATREQPLATLAIALGPLAGILLAFPRCVATVAGLSLYTFGHLCRHGYPIRLSPKAQPARAGESNQRTTDDRAVRSCRGRVTGVISRDRPG